jgi:hypothetical protein
VKHLGMKRLATAVLLAALAAPFAAQAQEGVTVESLLKDGYEVKGAFPSNAGPGLVLQKGDQLTMCFVAETQKSADIVTQYCKPVH